MKRLLYLLLTTAMSQDLPTSAGLLGPQHFNHHPFDAEQYLKSLNLPVPTQKGPVLFPNDAPPPPRPPLVVTSRPLIESIARSNLNPVNNSIAQSSNNGVSFVPYLGRVKDYKPYFSVGSGPYNVATERYYQTQTSLPPTYKTIASQSRTIQNPEQRLINYDYQVKEPEYTHQQSNEVRDGTSGDYGNYAFSYAVKDKDTGDDFSHSQQSSGSGTKGEYKVRLPDGRIQIVSYTADENGYKADVRYDETSVNGDNNNVYNNVQHDNEQYVDNKVTNYLRDNNNKDYNNNINVYNNVEYDNKQHVDNKVTNYLTDNNNKDYNNNINVYNNVEYDTKQYVDDKINNHITDKNNIDYNSANNAQPRDFKKDYYNNYDSKEYYNDYSSEYNENYLPHRNKFVNLVNKPNNIHVSTVRPSYEEIKDLFTPDKFYNKQNVELTTKYPFVATTENVVLIGAKPKLYTNILGSTLSPIVATTVTPRSYLVSTIANLKKKLNLNQPVLSERFIDKINKYLKFN